MKIKKFGYLKFFNSLSLVCFLCSLHSLSAFAGKIILPPVEKVFNAGDIPGVLKEIAQMKNILPLFATQSPPSGSSVIWGPVEIAREVDAQKDNLLVGATLKFRSTHVSEGLKKSIESNGQSQNQESCFSKFCSGLKNCCAKTVDTLALVVSDILDLQIQVYLTPSKCGSPYEPSGYTVGLDFSGSSFIVTGFLSEAEIQLCAGPKSIATIVTLNTGISYDLLSELSLLKTQGPLLNTFTTGIEQQAIQLLLTSTFIDSITQNVQKNVESSANQQQGEVFDVQQSSDPKSSDPKIVQADFIHEEQQIEQKKGYTVKKKRVLTSDDPFLSQQPGSKMATVQLNGSNSIRFVNVQDEIQRIRNEKIKQQDKQQEEKVPLISNENLQQQQEKINSDGVQIEMKQEKVDEQTFNGVPLEQQGSEKEVGFKVASFQGGAQKSDDKDKDGLFRSVALKPDTIKQSDQFLNLVRSVGFELKPTDTDEEKKIQFS